ncbi:unnamed protein product [Withania somnifera]
MSHFSPIDTSKIMKIERYNSYFRRVNRTKLIVASSKFLFRVSLLVALLLIFFFIVKYPSFSSSQNNNIHTTTHNLLSSAIYGGGATWEKQVFHSSTPRHVHGLSVLVTGCSGLCWFSLLYGIEEKGDGVLGIDNFNSYYDPTLKRARRKLLGQHEIFIVEGDINNAELLTKLLDIVPFTHVLHLAAQAGVRYAMKNPLSYIQSNIAGFVNLLEIAKLANPQPAIVWASSSSVYGLNTNVPFSEDDPTDQPASLYAATKKAGEEIAYTYNHIYGVSLTGLRFFTVYGPWGRPDMAYFLFTKDMLRGKPINVYVTQDEKEVARDFTYIDDIVKGCLGALDTAEKSTGSGGKKAAPAQLRVYNLGNTSPVSVNKLVTILESLLNVKAKKNVIKMPRNGDVPYTHANVTLAKMDFGYKPTTDLSSGLRKFVKWYVSYYEIQSPVNL